MNDTNTALLIIVIVIFIVYYIKTSEDKRMLLSKIDILNSNISKAEIDKIELNESLNFYKNSSAEGFGKYSSAKDHVDALVAANKDLVLQVNVLQDQVKTIHGHVSSLALKQFESFKQNEVELLKISIKESVTNASKIELASWKVQYEASIRQDAIMRSQAVNLGQITEHFIPFNKAFPYNPKEARFIGSPIDMIVFNGVDDGDIVNVIFLEIKTSGSRMSKRQRLIRDAVEAGRISFQELRM